MGTFNENDAIAQLTIGQDVFWSNTTIKGDEAEFDALYGRLEQLESLGQIAILDSGRESYTGRRYIVRAKIRRLR